MAAATSAIVAVAGLGLSAYQMYQQSEAQKSAEAAAEKAKQDMMELEEKNVMEAIQAPDISSIAFERQAQADIQALDKIQAAGAEAVIGGVPAQTEASRQAALETANQQAAINFQVDLERKRNEQAIASRKYQKELGMAYGELEGAQQAAADAEMGKQAAMMDMVAGAGNVATGIGQATSLEATAQRQSNQSSRQAMNQAQAQSDYLADANLAYNSGIFNDGEKGVNVNYGKYLNYLQSGAEQINRP